MTGFFFPQTCVTLLRMDLCEHTMIRVQICRGSFADVWGSFADRSVCAR